MRKTTVSYIISIFLTALFILPLAPIYAKPTQSTENDFLQNSLDETSPYIQISCPYWKTIGPFEGNYPLVIEIDPSNSNIIYVGTSGSSGLMNGLYKSTNAGLTWAVIKNSDVVSLVINPTNPTTMFVGTGTRLYKTTNGGGTWMQLGGDDPNFIRIRFTALAMDPTDVNTIYAGGCDPLSGWYLYVSYDAGATWSLLLDQNPATPAPNNPGIEKIAVNRVTPGVIYGTVYSSGVYKSNDFGTTWSWMNTGLTDFHIYDIETGTIFTGDDFPVTFLATDGGVFFARADNIWHPRNTGLTSLFVVSLAAIRSNALRLYAGTDNGVFQTMDGGVTWTQTTPVPPYHYNDNGEPLYPYVVGLQVDQHNMNSVYCSYYDIVYKSVNHGASWSPIGLPITQITTLEFTFNPQIPDIPIFYAGASPGGFYSGLENNWVGRSLPEVKVIKIIPNGPDRCIFAGTYCSGAGLFASYNNAESWTESNEGLDTMESRCIEALAVDPTDHSILYLGTLDGVYKSTTQGTTWTTTGLTQHHIHVISLAIHPTDPNIIYAGTQTTLYRSTDAGVTWTALDTTIDNDYYMCIEFNQQTPETIYVGTYHNGMIKTTDSGATWATINNGITNLNVRDILVFTATNPNSQTKLYIGTWGGGVFTSNNDGTTWYHLTTRGMREQRITSLEYTIYPLEGIVIYAGSFGGGIYRYYPGNNYATPVCLTAPNGGETWRQGSKQTITWDWGPDETTPDKVYLYVSTDGGKTTTFIDASPNTAGTNKYLWTIPKTIPDSSACLIKIESGQDSKIYDWSDDVFSIRKT